LTPCLLTPDRRADHRVAPDQYPNRPPPPVPSDWAFLERIFRERFGVAAACRVEAPGRVNLIGDHTDYNDGVVLPAAINRYVRLVVGTSDRPVLRLHSADFDQGIALSVDHPGDGAVPRWGRYVQGVAGALQQAGVRLRGMNAVLGGDLPIGAGLSSSAALEVVVVLGLLHAAGISWPPRDTAMLAQRAETEFVGVQCGIMDQFAVTLTRPGHALFLDCRALTVEHVPIPPSVALVVCNTGVRRALAHSAYHDRQRECAQAVESLRRLRPGVRALRDLTPEDLELLSGLPEPLRRRARHVITENQRVLDAVVALRRGDLATMGDLLRASHASLRDDYEVSVPAVEAMVAAAERAPGCVGARLTGAGFGGAVVAFVERTEVDRFVAEAADAYRSASQTPGVLFACDVVGGAAIRSAATR